MTENAIVTSSSCDCDATYHFSWTPSCIAPPRHLVPLVDHVWGFRDCCLVLCDLDSVFWIGASNRRCQHRVGVRLAPLRFDTPSWASMSPRWYWPSLNQDIGTLESMITKVRLLIRSDSQQSRCDESLVSLTTDRRLVETDILIPQRRSPSRLTPLDNVNHRWRTAAPYQHPVPQENDRGGGGFLPQLQAR